MNVSLFDLLDKIGEDKLKEYKVYIMGNEGYYKFDIEQMRANSSIVVEIVILNAARRLMWIRL